MVLVTVQCMGYSGLDGQLEGVYHRVVRMLIVLPYSSP